VSGRKLIPIAGDGMVHLAVSPLRWSMLPNNVRRMLLDGAKNVAQVRSQICDSAPVHWMPPVEILDEIWICSKRTIHGKTAAITVATVAYLGAQLPAQTAVHRNNEEFTSHTSS
jgi:hypothetical protein